MMDSSTVTATKTATVVDIRKTFEGFAADLSMIARRTGKWSPEYVEQVFHDIVQLAEGKYLKTVDIILLNQADKPLQATRFTVNADGKAISGDKAGGNAWSELSEAKLTVALSYTALWTTLGENGRAAYVKEKAFKIGWVPSSIDTSYRHLKRLAGQLYASSGYELQKDNFN